MTTDGVCKVLLYGSVARGEQIAGSDIDLVVVFDDIDYTARHRLASELRVRARRAASYRVDVRVTDLPEWTHRSEAVTTSFERDIARHALVLFDAEPGEVNWEKEIGLPATNEAEAVASLIHARIALVVLLPLIGPQPVESAALEESAAPVESAALEEADLSAYRSALSGRLSSLCGQAHAALENSLKALVHLRGDERPPRTHDPFVRQHQRGVAHPPAGDERPPRTHDPFVLPAMLTPDVRGDAEAILGDVAEMDASLWRARGTYPGDFLEIPLATHAPLTCRMATAAAALTRYVAYVADRIQPARPPGGSPRIRPVAVEGLPPHAAAETTMARRVATGVTEALGSWDPSATTPTAVMGCPSLPEERPPPMLRA